MSTLAISRSTRRQRPADDSTDLSEDSEGPNPSKRAKDQPRSSSNQFAAKPDANLNQRVKRNTSSYNSKKSNTKRLFFEKYRDLWGGRQVTRCLQPEAIYREMENFRIMFNDYMKECNEEVREHRGRYMAVRMNEVYDRHYSSGQTSSKYRTDVPLNETVASSSGTLGNPTANSTHANFG